MVDKPTKIERQLASLSPEIKALLTRGGGSGDKALDRAVFGHRPKRWDDMDAVEAEVRKRMAQEVDDLRVAFQVAHSRAVGYPCELWIEHFCLAGSIEACIQHHGYMMRCAGPVTLEVHEREQKIIANWPAMSDKIARKISAAISANAEKIADAVNRAKQVAQRMAQRRA